MASTPVPSVFRQLAGLCLAAAVCTAPPDRLSAQDRMVRRYAAGQGFTGAPVVALAQDDAGFLWIGGQDGLYRYDGNEFRRWASADVDVQVRSIATAGDRVVVLTADGALLEVVGERARPLPSPLPAGSGEPNGVAFDARGRLWAVRGGRAGWLERRTWHAVAEEAFGGEAPRHVRASPDGRIAVATRSGVWTLSAGKRPVKAVDIDWPSDFVFLAAGGLAAIGNGIRAVTGADQRAIDPFRLSDVRPRPIAIAERQGTVWASYDRFLVALRPGRPPEVIGPNQGVESGGPLLVDREGSLWMGTFTALLQYPEPDTRIWNERTGLHSQHTRFVARSGRTIWVTTWQGAATIRPDRGDAMRRRDVHSQGDVCDDADGDVWLQVSRAVLRAKGERVVLRHPTADLGHLRCARDPAGGLWLALGNVLHRADSSAFREVIAPALPDDVEVLSMLQDRGLRLWVGGENVVCAGAVRAPDTIARWDCTHLPGAGLVLALRQMPSGSIWAATSRRGVFTLLDGAWAPAAENEMLPSTSLLNLIPSRAGGVWLLGHGVVWRVEEHVSGGRWIVSERLGEWHGLPLESGRDLHEDADGTLWITTSLGVIEVPPSARTPSAEPPNVELVKALVDEEPAAIGDTLELPFRRNRLELHFAVMSYRDPGRLRYQVRLSPDGEWREATGRPWFRWIDIPPRGHLAELRASLDGEHWTAQPAALAFRVRPPWYRTAWAIVAFVSAASLLLWATYRARVGYLIGLERERTRIAMDLHDEMGSGLGSIGILSALLASRGLDDGRGRDLARRIAHTAQDLGGSLSGIIWSLDARPSTLGELASRLADAGGNLLAAQGIAFRAEFPDAWPPDSLSPRARRNLMLLGLEALHNAARHSRARSVVLALRLSGGEWEMRIADDGAGFDAAGSYGGHGLGTIRRRAEEIGATIEWDTQPGHGTAVAVRFSLRTLRAGRSPGTFEIVGRDVSTPQRAPPSAGRPTSTGGGLA